MTTLGSTHYKQMLARWAHLTRENDARGLTHGEGAELCDLARQLHAAELRGAIARVTDDYDETMQREAGHLGGMEW